MEHHYKAGNINNFLFNESEEDHDAAQFVLFLDNDMIASSDFLLRTLPFFYERSTKDSTVSEEEDLEGHCGSMMFNMRKTQYSLNTNLSFVQAPQRFRNLLPGDALGKFPPPPPNGG